MVYLSRKQEELIADLESYTVALQERAKNIENCDKKSRSSNVKRKRDVWKARNSSGQVAAALNARTRRRSSIDSDLSSGTMSLFMQAARQAADAMKSSPAKRARKIHAIPKKTVTTRSPQKALGATLLKPSKETVECYCQTINKNSKVKRTVCKFGRNCPLKNKSPGLRKDLSFSDLESQRKTLQEARSVIRYSPESIFLRRLKTRSQINLNAVDDESSGPNFTHSPNRGKHHIDEDSSESVTESTKECLVHRKPSSMKRGKQNPASKKSSKVQSKREKTPSPASNSKKTNGLRKSSPRSGKTRSSKVVEMSASCNCRQREMAGYDIVAGLVDNTKEKKQAGGPGEEKDKLVNKVSEFRRTHWFDCHATHDHPNDLAETSLLGRTNAPDGHECVHRYVLNDRLFVTPLYADAQNRSRCVKCHLPEEASTAAAQEPAVRPTRPRGSIEISLPKRVLSERRGEKPTAAGFKVSGGGAELGRGGRPMRGCPMLHPAGGGARRGPARPPVPADSLALRYQKGVA